MFDEPEQTKRGPKEPKARPAWQQPARKKEKKGKTEYKSYEDIVAEAGETVKLSLTAEVRAPAAAERRFAPARLMFKPVNVARPFTSVG